MINDTPQNISVKRCKNKDTCFHKICMQIDGLYEPIVHTKITSTNKGNLLQQASDIMMAVVCHHNVSLQIMHVEDKID